MSARRGKAEEERITWSTLFPAHVRKRFELLTASIYVMDGLRVLCDSGRVESAYFVVESLASRQMPVLPGHVDFAPQACRVYPAKSLFDYEDKGFIVAFYGFSGRSGDMEFTCLFIDDVLVYMRVCTHREVAEAWRRFREEVMEA